MSPPPLSTGDLIPDPEAEPDPHKRARMKYGEFPGAVMLAASASGRCQSAWVRYVESRREVIVELGFFERPSAEEKSEAARIAASEVMAWLGPEFEGWRVRVKEKRRGK